MRLFSLFESVNSYTFSSAECQLQQVMSLEGIIEVDRDVEKYKIWEAKFLGYLRSLSIKGVLLGVKLTGDEEDNERNDEVEAELVQ